MSGSFWDGVNPQSVGSAQDRGAQFNIGENEAYINQVNPKTSSKGNKMLEVILKKTDGAEIRYYIVDDEYKLGKLKALQKCFGIPLGNNEIDTTWKNKRGIVICRESKPKDNGKTYPEVNYFKALSDKTHSVGKQQGQAVSDGFIDDIPF